MIEEQNPIEQTISPEFARKDLEMSESDDLSSQSGSSPNLTEGVSPEELVGEEVLREALSDPDGVVNAPSSDESDEANLPSPEVLIAAIAQERDSLAQQLEAQNQQVDSLKQRYVALAAEFDNFRKRSQREKEELDVQIKCKTLGELLSVVDNFERARTQLKPNNDGEMAIHKSYQSVYKSLVDGLKRLGVSPMRPEGQVFDPSYHEAMLREYTNEYPEGTVIEQLVRGYVLGDQVLRHAMVKVAAPKEPDVPADDNVNLEGSVDPSDA